MSGRDRKKRRGRGRDSASNSENEVLIEPSALNNNRNSGHSIQSSSSSTTASAYEDDEPLLNFNPEPFFQPRPSSAVIPSNATNYSRTNQNYNNSSSNTLRSPSPIKFVDSPKSAGKSPLKSLQLSPLRPHDQNSQMNGNNKSNIPIWQVSGNPSPQLANNRPQQVLSTINLSLPTSPELLSHARLQLLNVPGLARDLNVSTMTTPPGSPPLVPSRNGSNSPATPPPTYPSPPEYISPPFVNGHRVIEFNLQPVATMGEPPNSNQDYEFAPEYGDDVGCLAGLRRSGHVLCLLFSLLLYGVIVLFFLDGATMLNIPSHSFNVIVFAVYSLYLIESMGCDTSSMLWQLHKAREAQQYFHRVIDTAPWLKWTLTCYHYKPWVNAATAKPKDRVFTYTKTIDFPLQGCSDESPMSFFTSHRLCKYTFKKEWRWQNDDAKRRYEGVMAAFVEENSKDDHYVLDESWGIDGFRDSFLASRAGTTAPWWCSWSAYALAMLCGFAFFFRILLASKAGTQVVKFKKVLF